MDEREPHPWWAHADLGRCWAALAARLERNGLSASGRTRIGGLSRAEQHALSDLLGRPVLSGHAQIDLAALDERLRLRAGVTLAQAAEAVQGRTLTDRPATRAAREARRELPLAAYRAWRAEHPEETWAGLDDWLESLRRDGVLTRAEAPAGLVRAALDIVWQRRAYLGTGASGALPEPIARTELAAQLFGDAHALDDGRRLGMVVQRAIECVVGRDGSVAGPGGSSRELWEQVGVLADRVSSTAMTLGVRVRLGSRPGERLAAYERTGAVAHLTWRDLDDGLAVEPGQTILVCENPRVVEAAADAGGADSRSERGGRAHCGGWASEVGLVCAGGRPALVVVALLDRLREAGARLLYHGDFDWPGLAIANLLVRRCGVRPWRMTAEDYFAVPAQLPLTGRRVEALWDPELAPAMARRGLAVHEEALLPGLISVDSLRT